jgi:secreted PhoX family phosphatase
MAIRLSFPTSLKEGVNVSGLDNPDNLALDNQGNVYIIEDNGPGDIFVARVSGGNTRGEVPTR